MKTYYNLTKINAKNGFPEGKVFSTKYQQKYQVQTIN